MIVNHKNGKKKDNHPGNLEIVTPSGNVQHAVHTLKVGRTVNQSGEQNHMAKLTNEAITEILKYRETILEEIKTRHGHKIAELAAKYGVNYHTVWAVIKGIQWNL
jgi:hypothetical protein